MIDGINTGYLPLDAVGLSERLGMTLNSHRVCHSCNGLMFGFVEMVDKDTGELRYMCKLRGSVHKYANRGAHNADAFRMSDLCRVFTLLRQNFDIRPNITQLFSVEFGVNIQLPYSPQRIIKATRMYRNYPFTSLGSVGVEYKADAFRFKIYDKGKQCGLHEIKNVLRIEIKAERNQLKKWGIYIPMLGDLLNADVWKRFEAVLLEAVENTMLVEAVPLNGLTEKECELFHLFTGDGWHELDKDKRYRKKKQFNALIERLKATDLKGELKSLIVQECKLLRDIDNKNRDANGKLSTDGSRSKVDNNYKSHIVSIPQTAMQTANFQAIENSKNRDANGFYMNGVSVAKISHGGTSLKNAIKQHDNSAKISDTPTDEAKSRGKPPNVVVFNGSG